MGLLIRQMLTADVAAATTNPATSGGGGDAGTSVWVVVALAMLGSSVVAGILTTALSNLRAAATSRREGYARAAKTLIARSEYPYRVRRRVSDEPEVLAALVERGHDIQEQLAACRTWVTSEHRVLGSLFGEALVSIDAEGRRATSDAWDHEPITTPAGMNLNGWGPGDQWSHVVKLERAIAYRFGWRRLLPSKWWQRRI